MGVFNHDHHNKSAVIDPTSVTAITSGSSFLELEDDSYHHWRQVKTAPSSDVPSRPASPSPKKHKEGEKHVSFAALHIREYSQVLGDHPCCSVGPPVSLGWDYTEAEEVSVETYEASRPRRRSRQALRLPYQVRREILSDVSDGDVRRVQRRLSRQRNQGRAVQSFFAASVSE